MKKCSSRSRVEDLEALDFDSGFGNDEDDLDLYVESRKRSFDKYTVTLVLTVKSNDIELAEDAVSDLIVEAVDKFGDNYEPDAKIMDFFIENIEIAEVE